MFKSGKDGGFLGSGVVGRRRRETARPSESGQYGGFWVRFEFFSVVHKADLERETKTNGFRKRGVSTKMRFLRFFFWFLYSSPNTAFWHPQPTVDPRLEPTRTGSNRKTRAPLPSHPCVALRVDPTDVVYVGPV